MKYPAYLTKLVHEWGDPKRETLTLDEKRELFIGFHEYYRAKKVIFRYTNSSGHDYYKYAPEWEQSKERKVLKELKHNYHDVDLYDRHVQVILRHYPIVKNGKFTKGAEELLKKEINYSFTPPLMEDGSPLPNYLASVLKKAHRSKHDITLYDLQYVLKSSWSAEPVFGYPEDKDVRQIADACTRFSYTHPQSFFGTEENLRKLLEPYFISRNLTKIEKVPHYMYSHTPPRFAWIMTDLGEQTLQKILAWENYVTYSPAAAKYQHPELDQEVIAQ